MKSRKMGLRLGALLLGAAAMQAGLQAQTEIGVEGPITAIHGTQIELFNGLVKFETRGAKIDTDDPNFKNIADLKVGTFIDVKADVDRDGTLRATLIEVSDEKDQAPEVGGVVGSVDTAAQTFTIGPLTISWTSQTKLKDLTSLRTGVAVEARVTLTNGKLVAELIEKDE
jgi:hypothetical protein